MRKKRFFSSILIPPVPKKSHQNQFALTILIYISPSSTNDPIEDFTPTPTTNSTVKAAKFVKKFINEGISDFFIGSYISTIIILQAVIFVFLSLYLIKITKYEKLEGDVNYANTILNDDEIYKVYKSDE